MKITERLLDDLNNPYRKHLYLQFIKITNYGLTKQQIYVLEYIMVGFTNKEIGDLFGISEKTVKFHIKNIFKKTNARSKYILINIFLKFIIYKYLNEKYEKKYYELPVGQKGMGGVM